MDSIKQKTMDVRGHTVRRMKWKAAREFLKKLGQAVSAAFKAGNLAVANSSTLVEGVVGALPELIAQTEELTTHLVVNSTDLTAAQFDDLDALEAAEIIRAAVEINLDDEIKNSFAGIAARAAALMPAVKDAPAAMMI